MLEAAEEAEADAEAESHHRERISCTAQCTKAVVFTLRRKFLKLFIRYSEAAVSDRLACL